MIIEVLNDDGPLSYATLHLTSSYVTRARSADQRRVLRLSVIELTLTHSVV